MRHGFSTEHSQPGLYYRPTDIVGGNDGGREPVFSHHSRRINFVALDNEVWSIVISYAGTP